MIENFGWLIEGQLAGSGGLIHHEELVWLREQGIGAIVSLTERSLRREKLLLHRIDPLGFIYRHIPVVDETAPSQAQVDEFVGFVDEMLGQEQAVLVHCRGGYGRTGTMLACYLVSRGWGAEEAMTELRARRPGSIMPRGQQACVVEYAERLRRDGFHKVADHVEETIATYDRIAPHYVVTATPEMRAWEESELLSHFEGFDVVKEDRIVVARGGFEFWLCKRN